MSAAVGVALTLLLTDYFVLVEGAVAVRRGGRRLADLGAGDSFGEIAILTYKPRTATVTAVSPVRLLGITRDETEAVIDFLQEWLARTAKRMQSPCPSSQP